MANFCLFLSTIVSTAMENDSLGVSIIQTAKGVQIHYQTHSQKVKDGMAILISIPPLPNKKGNEMVKK
jgi:hypothetical protein